MEQIETILQNINKFITLSRDDRGPYAKDSALIQDTIISRMRKLDPVFDKLYNGSRLGGSYADNLKINKPDEYDLQLRLKLKEPSLIVVKRAPKMPGYCMINIREALKKIQNESQNRDVYDRFSKFITPDGNLIQDEVSRWFQSLMTKVLRTEVLDEEGSLSAYQLKYAINGPAHTISVVKGKKKFSIDFVPAFVFDKSKWIAARRLPDSTPPSCQDWIALPKPVKGMTTQNTSFIASYTDTERHLIAGKNSLKNTLKMVKKLRDRRGLNNLKSYYIKTVYLWENQTQPAEFWNNSTRHVLMHMLNRLIDHLEKADLRFFWDEAQNMFANLTPNQIQSILNEIRNAIKILTNDMGKIYDLFLTIEEIEKLPLSGKSAACNRLDSIDGADACAKNEKPNAIVFVDDSKAVSEADKKVCEIKKILQKYENNSEKILTEIRCVLDQQQVKSSWIFNLFGYRNKL